jgi:phage terminase small subunit
MRPKTQKIPKTREYINFLTPTGVTIYKNIIAHCKKYGIEEVDHMEMSMLANAFDMYIKYATICNKESGAIQGPFDSGYSQVSPEYNIMKQQYDLIMKHSNKFGLNPADREKIFSSIKQTKKESPGFNLN